VEIDVRIASIEVAEALDQPRRRECRQDADPQAPSVVLFQPGSRTVQPRQRLPDDREESLASGCQNDLPAEPQEELRAEMLLEEADAMADGAVREVQLLCRLRKTCMPCHRLECGERMKRRCSPVAHAGNRRARRRTVA